MCLDVFACVPMSYNDGAVFVSLSHTPIVSCFSQVMRETDTQVKWPSKLKIGAKSKKGDGFLIHVSLTTIDTIVNCFVFFFLQVFLFSHIHFQARCIYTRCTETQFISLSRSTCEGGRKENQCFGSQKNDSGSAGNTGDSSCA